MEKGEYEPLLIIIFFVPRIIPEFQIAYKKEQNASLYLLITHIHIQVYIDTVRKLNI